MSSPGRIRAVLIVLSLATVTTAFTSFQPLCTAPTSAVSYVAIPNSRGTIEIVWACVFAIFACTWTVHHPNLPRQRRKGRRGWGENMKCDLRDFWESTKLAFYTIIAPEAIVSVACSELLSAYWILGEHGIHCDEPLNDSDSWTISEIQFANMGGFTTLVEGETPGKAGTLYHLTAFEILNMWEEGRLLKGLPRIDLDELYDRSKCDFFVKTLSVAEILWSVLQVLIRVARNLVVSPLELAVLAFSACACITYALYWMKPKNVYTTIHVPLASPQLVPAADLARYRQHNEVHIVREFLLPPIGCMKAQMHHVRPAGDPLCSVTSLRIPRGSHYANVVPRIAGYFAAALFGGIHAAAWQFPFPSATELCAWRCATIYTAIYGPITFSQDLLLRRHRTVQKSVFCVLTWLYVIARLVIISEMVRTMFYLPTESFMPTWVPEWTTHRHVWAGTRPS
ncbi:hypothetical protein QBC37DRAFT_325081 [Rhypophila decipiens]|uniref:Integral membrane protein n=1 Tax=Rhypophila decipiens TaxID=261697 RepID=A0AAN6XXL5_9PEZI|nr:hypothetical protein QBC37DRAFT_325081 [Rhypophila decipiens]